MTKLEELEKAGKQAWLATIGTYAKGWEILSGKVNETFEDTNKIINELVENGEKIESNLKEKIKSNAQLDDKILALKIKLGVEESFDDKLDLLSEKVNQLAIVIEKLVEVKAAKLATVEEVKKAPSKLAKEVAVEKKAPAKRSAVKEVNTATEVTTTVKPRRTSTKAKVASLN